MAEPEKPADEGLASKFWKLPVLSTIKQNYDGLVSLRDQLGEEGKSIQNKQENVDQEVAARQKQEGAAPAAPVAKSKPKGMGL